jgi:membrane protein
MLGNLKVVGSLLGEVFHDWNEDKAPRLGAALAYYSVFSLAPLVVIAIGIAALVFDEQTARGGIVREIEETLGQPAARAIEDLMKHAQKSGQSGLATALGLVVLLFGASGVFIQLQDALNTIWKVTPKAGGGLWTMIRDRLLSFAVVLGTGFLLLVSLVVSAALAALSKFLTSAALPGGIFLWQVVTGLVSLAIITLLFALIYKVLPALRIAWKDVWIGAAVTALLFTGGKFLLGWYLGQGSTASAFGAAGSLVVILIWVYYSAQILLFGAEFTRVYAKRFGTHQVATEKATQFPESTPTGKGMASPPAHLLLLFLRIAGTTNRQCNSSLPYQIVNTEPLWPFGGLPRCFREILHCFNVPSGAQILERNCLELWHEHCLIFDRSFGEE